MPMNHSRSQLPIELNYFTALLLGILKRHPKRVVFAEGEDIRVIRVAARLVQEEAIAPILLGKRNTITALAEEESISLRFIRIINPETAQDLPLFCERFTRIERLKGNPAVDALSVMSRPLYFAAMMVQYGQADAMIAGNHSGAASVIRAATRMIKPLSPKHSIFGVMAALIPDLEPFGNHGLIFAADTGITPDPSVSDLAYIALSTGHIARHILGRNVQVALISSSTKSSHNHPSAQRSSAATALAQSNAYTEGLNEEIKFLGEIQIDAALDPEAYAIRYETTPSRPSSDALIFPSLDAADIWIKSLKFMPDVKLYGMFLAGLSVPVVQIPRQVNEDRIFGSALAAGIEAIKSHELYPQGTTDID